MWNKLNKIFESPIHKEQRESHMIMAIPNVENEDFIETPLKSYSDAHLQSLLIDVRDIIPEKYYNRVFVAGGFASHLAGITQEHGDIDLFCADKATFDALLFIIQNNPDRFCSPEGSGFVIEVKNHHKGYENRILKFVYNNFNYDLVDISKVMGVGTPLISILYTFDFNWAMVGIDLIEETVICHTDALSDKPIVNQPSADCHLEGTIERIQKYIKRLTKTPHQKACKNLNHYLTERSKELIKQNAKQWASFS